jgi:hypothetical protein
MLRTQSEVPIQGWLEKPILSPASIRAKPAKTGHIGLKLSIFQPGSDTAFSATSGRFRHLFLSDVTGVTRSETLNYLSYFADSS